MSFIDNTKRAWQPREMLMVTEYLAKNNLLKNAQTRVRLGNTHPDLLDPSLDPAELEMLRVYARWADAVIFEDNRTVIIEAKIRPRLGPLEGLELYRRLFLSDPQYKSRHHLPIELVFLYAIEDPAFNVMARERGIKTIEYKPDWLPDYLQILQHREGRAPMTSL